jgi:hypothetical protein
MVAKKIFIQHEWSSDLLNDFCNLATRYVTLWQDAGVKVHISWGQDFEIFKKASHRRKILALSYLKFNIQVMEDLIQAGSSFSDTKKFVWGTLKKLKLAPRELDFMEYIHDEDVVEIYFLDDVQVFRNKKFFEVSSLSVEDILCRPWYELVGRKMKYLSGMIAMTMKMKMGLTRQLTYWGVPEHEVWEKCSPENHLFKMQLKYFFPLFQEGKITAILTINHTQVIGKKS